MNRDTIKTCNKKMEENNISKPIHSGHRNRLRDKVKKDGLKNFSQHQVLEYLLSFVIARKDTNELAHKLINKFGNLPNVLDAPYEALVNTKGLGEVSATFLSTITEAIEYSNRIKYSSDTRIFCANDAFKIIEPILCKQGKEKLVILCIAKNDKLIHHEIVDIGDETKVETKVDKIMEIVKNSNAKKIILAHNHPANYFGPSEQDIKFTKTLFVMFQLAGKELLDHYIFTPNGEYYSFRAFGLLDDYRNQLSSMLDKR